MKELEKLAVLTALQKAVKGELDKVRATCENELKAQFDAEGIDRKLSLIHISEPTRPY